MSRVHYFSSMEVNNDQDIEGFAEKYAGVEVTLKYPSVYSGSDADYTEFTGELHPDGKWGVIIKQHDDHRKIQGKTVRKCMGDHARRLNRMSVWNMTVEFEDESELEAIAEFNELTKSDTPEVRTDGGVDEESLPKNMEITYTVRRGGKTEQLTGDVNRIEELDASIRRPFCSCVTTDGGTKNKYLDRIEKAEFDESWDVELVDASDDELQHNATVYFCAGKEEHAYVEKVHEITDVNLCDNENFSVGYVSTDGGTGVVFPVAIEFSGYGESLSLPDGVSDCGDNDDGVDGDNSKGDKDVVFPETVEFSGYGESRSLPYGVSDCGDNDDDVDDDNSKGDKDVDIVHPIPPGSVFRYGDTGLAVVSLDGKDLSGEHVYKTVAYSGHDMRCVGMSKTTETIIDEKVDYGLWELDHRAQRGWMDEPDEDILPDGGTVRFEPGQEYSNGGSTVVITGLIERDGVVLFRWDGTHHDAPIDALDTMLERDGYERVECDGGFELKSPEDMEPLYTLSYYAVNNGGMPLSERDPVEKTVELIDHHIEEGDDGVTKHEYVLRDTVNTRWKRDKLFYLSVVDENIDEQLYASVTGYGRTGKQARFDGRKMADKRYGATLKKLDDCDG